MEDERIVEFLWERDEKGITELQSKYGNQIKRLSEHILCEEDAEECVNDTYIAVWNSIPPHRPQFLYAYVAKICRNLALNRLEWNNASKRNAQVLELSTELEQCLPAATQSMEELGSLLSDFLRSLPEEKRRIFVRRYWYGDTIRELAEYYGYREGKIKSILFRVRNDLRNYLEKEGVAL